MKSLAGFIVFILATFLSVAQDFELWNTLGTSYKINDKISLSASFSSRMSEGNIKTFFPEATVKYKIVKWAHISMDYRMVSKRDDLGNYLGANRMNFNVKLRHSHKRFKYSCRVRYQMSSRGGGNLAYESDFDEAFRFKPAIKYNIRKSIFEPFFGLDFFYNPTNGIYGNRFDKVRYGIGTSVELSDAHDLDVSFKLDQRFNSSNNGNRLIFALAYNADLNKLLIGGSKKGL
tara:strand:+ start:1590 stop:2285 length:696 start_codon:yes stop_codon:yes gene_type:complete